MSDIKMPPAPSALAVETARQIRDLVLDTLSTPLNGDTTESFLPKATALLESAFAQARAQERERCAKACDEIAEDRKDRANEEGGNDIGFSWVAEMDGAVACAAAIREGGSNE